MKRLAKLAAVVGLTLSFGLVALGGETRGRPVLLPTPAKHKGLRVQVFNPLRANDSQTDMQTAQTSDYVTEATLELVQSVMLLL